VSNTALEGSAAVRRFKPAHVGADAFVRPASEASAPDECVRGYMTRPGPPLRGRDALATAGKMPALQKSKGGWSAALKSI